MSFDYFIKRGPLGEPPITLDEWQAALKKVKGVRPSKNRKSRNYGEVYIAESYGFQPNVYPPGRRIRKHPKSRRWYGMFAWEEEGQIWFRETQLPPVDMAARALAS